jgi:ParB-like chromosome segregation protein Spo0J
MVMRLDPTSIVIDDRARALRDDAVAALMESMRSIGLRTPITVRFEDQRTLEDGTVVHEVPILVTGRHRLEAAIRLGWDAIDAVEIEEDETDTRLWEIAENLHRAELTAVERAEHIDAWRKLILGKGVTNGHPLGGSQPHEQAIQKTAEALGVSDQTVRRSAKIAALPQEIRDQARQERWSRDRLLQVAKAAKEPTAAPEPLEEDDAVEAQVTRLMKAWNAAGPEARARFLARIGQ